MRSLNEVIHPQFSDQSALGSLTPSFAQDLPSEDEAEAEGGLTLFLAGLGLAAYAPALEAQDVDLEALTLLTEDDLKGLGLPLGPRRKLLLATRQRRAAVQGV